MSRPAYKGIVMSLSWTLLVVANAMLLGCLTLSGGGGDSSRKNSERMKVKELLHQIESAPATPFTSAVYRNRDGNVREVHLYGKYLTDENVALLAMLSSVEVVVLGCYLVDVPGLSTNSLSRLQDLPRLKELCLTGALPELTKSDCEAISRLSHLEILIVEYSQIDADGLAILQSMKQLRSLKVPPKD
jgi:hypothetical protein